MAETMAPSDLQALIGEDSSLALIDVREKGEFNSTHIRGFTSLPRRQLESSAVDTLPFKGVRVIVCDDDGRRGRLAAATLERMGYAWVTVLEGGINRWTTDGYPTEWGSNVISKEFIEKTEVEHQVPEMDSLELHRRIERGDKVAILDTRTPEEFRRFCIPGGRNVPGGELALRITDIAKGIDDDTTIVINCAGRARSIVGTRILQRMGMSNVYGLENGTSGWLMAGLELETGADRSELPEPSPEGLASAEAYAARLAAEDGVRYIAAQELQDLMGKSGRETVYLMDVRTEAEYLEGHIPDFRWVPGGQAVLRADEFAIVRNAAIVFACDGKVRATVTGSWFRQMGFPNVYVVDGGVTAWAMSGSPLEKGMPEHVPLGLDEARQKVRLLSTRDVQAGQKDSIIFVDTSRDFAAGHVPGSHWVPRGWLEFQIESLEPERDAPIVVTCSDSVNSILAGATLVDLGYASVAVLEGGMAAWQLAGLPVERGLAGVMTPPTDVVYTGSDRNFADTINYIRWAESLGRKR